MNKRVKLSNKNKVGTRQNNYKMMDQRKNKKKVVVDYLLNKEFNQLIISFLASFLCKSSFIPQLYCINSFDLDSQYTSILS